MRETCARVLAAVLMTGAIAVVVGMAAHLGTPTQSGRVMAVPRSSLQRTVRLTARPVPKHSTGADRVVTRRIRIQPRHELITRSLVVVRRHRAKRRPPRTLAATTTSIPAPTASPGPQPALDPAPAPPPPTSDQSDGPGHGHGRGHAYGHEQQDD